MIIIEKSKSAILTYIINCLILFSKQKKNIILVTFLLLLVVYIIPYSVLISRAISHHMNN